MKNKIFLLLSACAGLTLAACNDDVDYSVDMTPVLTDKSLVTGSADVTATTATLHATVDGLKGCAPASYTVGFNWGYSQSNLNESVNGSLTDGVVTAAISGLPDGTTIYYQVFVTLQGKLTYKGDVKSAVTTDTRLAATEATAIDHTGATLAANVSGAPADAAYGIVITSLDPSRSRTEASEAVRSGLIIPAANAGDTSFTIDVSGLVPSTTYTYAAYADLGSGIVYSEEKTFTTAPYKVDIENDLVDLGLSVKWAKHNVGAAEAAAYGGYFGFGDLTGVCNSIEPAQFASADVYRTDRDVANHAWNGAVTLPSAADFEELLRSCTKEWTEENGVAGYKFTGPNGNSIFLPAAGSRTINTVSGAGATGVYATGSVNQGNPQFAVAYSFTSGGAQRESTPVYEALSVRPVSTARDVKFDKSLLYNTWEIDYADGKSLMFAGPVHFYGTDDSWRTVSNGEPIVGNSWSWEADATNTWAFGECGGQMTLSEDGKISVTYNDGTTREGTYTIDDENKTITSTVPLLTPTTFPGQCANLTNEIRIFSLTADKLQMAFYRDADPALLSVNMIPKSKKYGYPVLLGCVDSSWAGEWSYELGTLSPDNLDGKHTFTYHGATSDVMVFYIDVNGLLTAYPDALLYINEIRCDGTPIPFDANEIRYGDIEGKGNYRLELFNIYGKNSKDGKVIKSPFSGATDTGAESAVHFSSQIEFDMVIITAPKSYTVQLISIDPGWAGSWDYSDGSTLKPVIDADSKISAETASYDITLAKDVTGAAYENGSIMTFIQIPGLKADFPDFNCTFDGLYLDGNEVTGYDPAMVLNTSDGDSYRFELWNMYGATSSAGCAFGTPVDGTIKGLGFSDNMRVKFTANGFFKPIKW